MKEHTKIEDSQKHIFLAEQNTKSNNRKVQSSVKYKAKKKEDVTCVVDLDITSMSVQNI